MKNIESKTELISLADETETKILKRLGHFFNSVRSEKNMSVRKLNELSGVSTAVISDLENKKSMPRIETIIRLALALGITDMDEVFSETLLENKRTKKDAWATIRQDLIDLNYTNAQIHQISHYMKFLAYLKDNKGVGIISKEKS